MDIIKKILKSVLITLSVAGLISFALSLMGVPFISSFILLIFGQFLFFYFYGEHNKKLSEKLIVETELKLLEEKNYQTLNVICPCDKKIETTIGIKLNRTNSYVCPGCNKNIGVSIESRTALSTTPASINPLDIPKVTEELEKFINKK